MTLKKTKIIKYTTSDGKVFVGGDNKQKANNHEDQLQKYLNEYRYIKKVAHIIGIDDKLKGVTEKKLMEVYDDPDGMDPELDMDTISNEIIDELFENAYCGRDCQDLEDMVDMVCGVIDDFGGIKSVSKLYDMHKKDRA